MEKDLPHVIQKVGRTLGVLDARLAEHTNDMNDLVSAAKPPSRHVLQKMEVAMNQVIEMGSALSAGELTDEQFDHITEAVRQLKFLALSKGENSETP